MNRFRILFIISVIASLAFIDGPQKAATPKYTYPETRKDAVSDNYFGTKVDDPYRWLEADTAPEVKQWVVAQNTVTKNYLSQIPYRAKIHKRLEEIWNYPKYTAPFKKGGNYFWYKNNGLQNQSVLFMTSDLNKTPQVLLDPNKLSTDGTVSLGGTFFSRNGRYMGYTINRSGSDWQEIYVVDVRTKMRTRDSLRWVKFSDIAWQGDGFYYSRFDAPKGGSGLSAENEFQKVYFHNLGDPQAKDKLVFMDKDHPLRNFGASTTEDERYLIIYGTDGASTGDEVYIKDLVKPKSEIKKLWEGFEFNYSIVDNISHTLLVLTNKNAPKYKLILVDMEHPDEKDWKTIIPESNDVLQEAKTAGGKIFAIYMQDAAKHAYQYDMDGKREREIGLPALGSVSGFDGGKQDKELFFAFTSFTYPSAVFRYKIEDGSTTVFQKPEVKFNPDDYVTKQIFYKSKDGTKIPMFIIHKKGLDLNGDNPTYLYGYGGFNISMNPVFSVGRLIILENGGVLAIANLRGGGEYGEDWHKAGMLDKKQNVFDDFIAAAEYLIENKYTSSQKLAIAGGSNGGLLIGACMTQRPELYKVALPAVGVMDMLRFHKFTIGHAWTPEYGSSENKAQFEVLYKYSPINNLKPAAYPATLVTTADHDDRVVPAHSFKFISTLQDAQLADNPVMIRIDSKAGHGAGKPTGKQIDEWTDIWSFVFYNMGITPKY